MSRTQAVRIGGLAAALLAWEGVSRLGWISPIILASPSAVLAAIRADGGVFLQAFEVTLAEIAIAIALAWSLGIGVGVAAGSLPRLGATAGPLLSSLFAIPLIILYPLFVAWVGMGPASKILFGAASGFFPIALNALSGVRCLDPRFALVARGMGATTGQIFFKVLLPLALPAIISGLRVGTSLIIIGVVVTEMLASVGGVGFLISYHRTMFNTGHVYLGIFLALLAALLVNRGLSHLEERFGRWRILEQTRA
ncbi:MAG: ABC transporter permease [Deltaproteobacteria bacterium]|nr:ABC transporter permease [Deltaproteobacteria bacterium]MBI3075675.1 ABC transporter permease [Deltaproteobacteria bacterium]